MRCVPSSSTAKAPHSSATVPSSIRVTRSLATCSPLRPANTEASFWMASASRPWPHASWKRTPPPPLPMTTGMVPDGAGRACKLRQSPIGRSPTDLFDVDGVEQFEPDRSPDRFVARLHAGVARRDGLDDEERADLIVLGEHAVAVGDEDPPATVAVACHDLGDRTRRCPGRFVGACEQFDLGRLGDRLGKHCGLARPRRGRPGQIDDLGPAAAAACCGRCRFGRAPESALGEIRRVGEPGGVAGNHPDARTTAPPRTQLFDLAVVVDGRCIGSIFDEDLGELTAGRHRDADRGLDE